MTTQPEIVTLSTPSLSVAISTLGAELQSLRDATGREVLWHGDATWWSGRAPILFPIVGALQANTHVVDGKAFILQKHGFARRSLFTAVDPTPTSVTLRLEASAETLAAYPYLFRLDLTFAISDTTLMTTAEVTNAGSGPMPFSFGYHPAFLWPLPGAGERADQVVDFDQPEPTPAARIDADGLLARIEDASRIVDRRLALTDDLFDADALLYLSPASRRLRFGAADGQGTSLEIAFPDTPHLGIWTKPGGAPYLCIEPWQGYASPAGFTGSLTDKPGTLTLAPGGTHTMAMLVTIRD